MKKIVIIGSALSGNKGAAAMLESSIQTLSARLPRVKFTLLSMYPAEDRRQNPYKNLEIINAKPLQLGVVINSLALLYKLAPFLRAGLKRRSRAIRALAEADVLLDQGGITFVDGREKFLIYNIASILPALFIGTPVFKCAQALGPFKNPVNRLAAKIFLPRMATIVSRGAITDGYLRGLKLKNVEAGADYAFSLELTPAEKKAADVVVDTTFFKAGKGVVVGVSPSVVLQKKAEKAGKDYSGIIGKFIDRLTTEGHRVVLLPHSVRNSDKTHNNDLPLCRAIYAGLKNQDKVLFIDQELSSQVLRAVIGRCDIFISSRFHAMVSSLAMKVPTLVIGWSHKYKEVLEMFELEEWAFGQDKLTSAYLYKRFARLLANRQAVREKLAKHLPAVKRASRRQADLIVEVVNS